MKYMGSKRYMLQNGLGKLIIEHGQKANRIVDLFCGAGAIAWYAAENTTKPVLAADLQSFATVLASAVIGREHALNPYTLEKSWLDKIERAKRRSKIWNSAVTIESSDADIAQLVQESRILCGAKLKGGPIWNAYGGHYFGPQQSWVFDAMLKYLPDGEPERSVCLAATISTASKCAAAPGHTAQPFQPTETAGTFLRSSWQLDPLSICKRALDEICPRHARTKGQVQVGDALQIAATLNDGDLVIVDPPYSGVQYSRFYHVLETLARGQCGPVEGKGRYPAMHERPQSEFSNKSQAYQALRKLLSTLANTGATIIFTFPFGASSNGLSGGVVLETARIWFDVEEHIVNGRFSTLGGNGNTSSGKRSSRQDSSELLLVLHPSPILRAEASLKLGDSRMSQPKEHPTYPPRPAAYPL
jgi:adenine-specific DNA-methyltransferase